MSCIAYRTGRLEDAKSALESEHCLGNRMLEVKVATPKKKTKVLPKEEETENQINVGSETLEEESGTTVDGKGDNIFQILKFEMPELDLSSDLLIPMLKMQDLCKIQESIFAVEKISVEYQTDQSNFLLEDGGWFKGQNHPCYGEFPLLEVDVSVLGIFSSIYVDNEIIYEELKFFDLLSFEFSEFFSDIEALSEVETSKQMFCEASKVSNFSDLIVSHELTLVLEELDGCTNDFNMKSYDAGVLVLESILSDDNQNVPYNFVEDTRCWSVNTFRTRCSSCAGRTNILYQAASECLT